MLLLVGAPRAGARNTGRTFAYTSLSTKPAFVMEADETGGGLAAMFVSVVGDVNKDGVADAYMFRLRQPRQRSGDRAGLRAFGQGRLAPPRPHR